MPLADKDPTQITEADLLGLIGNEPEGKSIDYKRDLVGQGESDKNDFLYEASSFANTQGGYLILGMEEAARLLTKLVGVGNIDAEKEIQRLEQMMRDGIRPSLSGVATAPLVTPWEEKGADCLERAIGQEPMRFASMVSHLMPHKAEVTTTNVLEEVESDRLEASQLAPRANTAVALSQ